MEPTAADSAVMQAANTELFNTEIKHAFKETWTSPGNCLHIVSLKRHYPTPPYIT